MSRCVIELFLNYGSQSSHSLALHRNVYTGKDVLRLTEQWYNLHTRRIEPISIRVACTSGLSYTSRAAATCRAEYAVTCTRRDFLNIHGLRLG
jgi:hypothetical protein